MAQLDNISGSINGLDRLEVELRGVEGVGDIALIETMQEQQLPPLHIPEVLGYDPNLLLGGAETPLAGESPAREELDILPPAVSYGGELMDIEGSPQTLAAALRRASQLTTDRGILYLMPDGTERHQTYAELLDCAERILTGLHALGLKPGDTVLFQFELNENFISAFWACVLGGILPTPCGVPPVYDEGNAGVGKLRNAWQLLGQPIILTDRSLCAAVAELAVPWHTDQLRVAALEPLMDYEPDQLWYDAKPEDRVLHLLTSGSTGIPKCVQHQHRSILSRVKATAALHGFTSQEVSLNWMPLDHVGGLVMYHVLSVYLACEQILPKIEYFIADPTLWLTWIERYRATKTWAPNFAFALVNEQQAKIQEGSWDLSSMRHILNGGEAVVAKTAHTFLRMLTPHGLQGDVMFPSFGMSETSSGIVFSKLLHAGNEDNGVLRFEKNSMGGILRHAGADHPGSVSFTEVGAPIPGVSVRIVDLTGEQVTERRIGRVQVAGPTIMEGYYNNPEANAEVFTDDGWFETGDLGFLYEGRLTITGRQKDMIIVNGNNFHNYEIEVILEEVDGVEVTFSAVCAVPREDGSEGLAVFFTPSDTDEEGIIRVIQEIHQHLIRKLGIRPDEVIPVAKGEFPKTNSGKIQRAEFSKRLANGQYADIRKRIDLLLRNERTMPDWIFEPYWKAEKLTIEDQEGEQPVKAPQRLIFADERGLGDLLARGDADNPAGPSILVRPGEAFARTGARRYTLHPARREDYIELIKALKSEEYRVDEVFHLWSYGQPTESLCAVEEVQLAQERGSISLLFLIQALLGGDSYPHSIAVVTTDGQKIFSDELVAFEKAPMTGFIKTLPHEHPDLVARLIDFESRAAESDVYRSLVQEIAGPRKDIVAYREGQRYVPGLRKTNLLVGQEEIPFVNDGLYLITGGLGGIGCAVASYLLEHYQAKLLILGRSNLHPVSGDTNTGSAEDKQAALRDLERLATRTGGSVRYETAKLGDLEILRNKVEVVQQESGTTLAGVIHLAGTIQEQLLMEQTREQLEDMYAAKVYGTFVLHQLCESFGDVLFVTASSARTLTGGMTIGAYCAANEFVQSMAVAHAENSRVRTHCFSWSQWDGLGMSRDLIVGDVLESKGFARINKTKGVFSLIAGLRQARPLLYVGLDDSKAEIRTRTGRLVETEKVLQVFFTGQRRLSRPYLRQAIETFRTEHRQVADLIRFIHVDAIPMTGEGTIDRKQLALMAAEQDNAHQYTAPRTQQESELSVIWEKLLGVDKVGITDNFFALGGHSLRATQLMSLLREAYGVSLPLKILFLHPTVESLAVVITEQRQDGATEHGPRRQGRVGDILPMSFAQKRQWFMAQWEPGNPFYINTITLQLSGKLNREALQRSLQIIVDRHETLRTIFDIVKEEPSQIILQEVSVELPYVDLKGYPEPIKEEQVRNLIREEARTPFSLASDPMIRAQLLQLDEERHLLLVSIHHIVSDGWSIGVFVRELCGHYESLSSGRLPDSSELPLQYADYTLWQQEWMNNGGLIEQLAYWKEQYADGVPVLDMPLDFPRPPVQLYRGKTKEYLLSASLTAGLSDLSQQAGATLFMTLLAGFSALIHRYTGQEDFVLGSVIANRNWAGIEPLIGFFVNTLALRMNTAGDPSLEELLQRVKETTLGAYDHQDVPFEMLVDELQVERDLSRQPLFQVLLVLQNAPVEAVGMGEVTMNMRIENNDTSKFDLALHLFEEAGGLRISLEYNTDLFLEQTVDQLVHHYETLLAGAVAAPYTPLSKLPLLTDEEQTLLLDSWSGTQADYPRDSCLQELFEQQVKMSPDASALVYEDGLSVMTYRDLAQDSEILAGYLQTLGVGPGILVGVLLDRSPEMIIAIVAIIRAGGAYVPMDPEYPKARLDYMLCDTESHLVITQSAFLPLLGGMKAPCFTMDPGWKAQTEGTYNLRRSVSLKLQAAYVNYTSGSTGQPKGVLIPHRAVIRLVKGTAYVSLGSEDTALQIANYAFDAFTYELWGMLLNGGRLVLTDRDTILSMDKLAEAFDTYRVTTGFLTVPLFNRLMEERPACIRHCTALLVGGDALSISHIRKGLEVLPQGLLNGYGPTENTTFSCVYSIGSLSKDAQSVPIGKPVSNSRAYILDTWLTPVPAGVPGELYVGGDGLALGYIHDDERTRRMFVPDPFHPEGAGRMYRTGDRAKWLPDGTIEYLGRLDNQVKIRGFRVETGEVEAALMLHPAVKECVVVPHLADNGMKQLAAYLVTNDSGQTKDWRMHLMGLLPDYMIPRYFVIVDQLPLNANGKIDKRALPAPLAPEVKSEGVVIQARNETEQAFVEIWRKLLDVQQIGVNDNFFDLGGDSIVVIQMVANAARAGYRISPKQVFQMQTIVELAACAEEVVSKVETDQGLARGGVLLTPIQKWFFEQDLQDKHHWNLPALIPLENKTEPDVLAKALQHVILHHDALRMRYVQWGEEWQQEYGPPAEMPEVRIIDTRTLDAGERETVLLRESERAQAGLSLELGKVLQAVFFQGEPGSDGWLFLAVHHLVVDGVSWRIILEDLKHAITQIGLGQTVDLPAKTASFQQWSEALTEYAGEEEIESQLSYWQSVTHSMHTLPLPELLTPQTEDQAVQFRTSFSKTETDRLLTAANQAYHTEINDLLLVALYRTLSPLNGESGLGLTLEGHGREYIGEGLDINRTVGWFTTSYPVILRTPAEIGLEEQIKTIKETLRQIPGKGLGYGLLRYLSNDPQKRESLAMVSPKVSFNYLGQLDRGGQAAFFLADARTGHYHTPTARREHAIDIHGFVLYGELQMVFTMHREHADRPELASLAERFRSELLGVIAHCTDKGTRGWTPSDFPLLKLELQDCDRLPMHTEDAYPLSPMQQGMLFHSLYEPDSNAYHGQINLTISGSLDLGLYENVWRMLVQRHPILRTRFLWEGLSDAIQVVLDTQDLSCSYVDLTGLEDMKQQEQLDQWLQEDRHKGFQLDLEEPLMRIAFVQLAAAKTIFIWSFHHILLDGWSLFQVFNESLNIYHSLAEGRTEPVVIRTPYKRYIQWLNQLDKTRAQAFWRSYLSGFTEATLLPGGQTSTGAIESVHTVRQESIRLSSEESRTLEAGARRLKVTVGTLMQTAWGLLLQGYSGQNDILFGVTVSGRPAELEHVETMVGLFINTLPLRMDIQAEQTLHELLLSTQETCVVLREFEHSLLPEIQLASRIPAREALFNSIVVFENYPVENMAGEELTVSGLQSYEQTNYDLSLIVVPGACYELRVSYLPHRYNPDAIRTLMGRLTSILHRLTEKPEAHVASLWLLEEEEEIKMLEQWVQQARVVTLYEDQEEVYAGVNDLKEDTELYILDRYLRPVPPGIPGDVYIGSLQLKRHCGSWSEWMQEHAISHPFGGRTGGLLYQTGDTGVWQEDGTVKLLELV